LGTENPERFSLRLDMYGNFIIIVSLWSTNDRDLYSAQRYSSVRL
jgi:hypothetical protein